MNNNLETNNTIQLFCSPYSDFLQRHIDRYLKNGVFKRIVHVIKYTDFQLYRVQPDGVI